MTTRRTPRKTTRRTSSTSPVRRQSKPATILGAAVGTVVVSFVVGAPWSVRIAVIAIVLIGIVGYLAWSRRR